MDKHLIHERFARAIPTYDRHAVVQRHIACRMAELLDEHLPSSAHRRVWEIGCGTGLFTRAYLKQHTPDDYLLNDLCPEMERTLADLLNERTRFTAGDAEQTAPDGLFSLITSCSSLQWFEEPLRFLETCHAYLNRDGYLAFTLFGEDNFHELRDIANASLPYHPLGYWLEAATQRGYRPALAERGTHHADIFFTQRRAPASETNRRDRHPARDMDKRTANRLHRRLCTPLHHTRRTGHTDLSSYLYHT